MNHPTISSQPQQILKRTVLDNGITLIHHFNPTADIISARFFLKAGSRWEPKEKSGMAYLMATVLTKGTSRLTSAQIADLVESVGAHLGADAAADYFVLSLKTVSADFPSLLDLTGEIMRYPSFPEAEVDLERRLTVQSIRSGQEQPFNIAFKQLRGAMYQEHPYGVSVLGTEETVSGLTREDLEQFHRTYFRPDNLIISLAGRLSHEAALELVEPVFGDWEAPATPIPTSKLPLITSQPSSITTAQDTQQSIVMLGYWAAAVHDEDYLALKLINTYLGNGLSSRLFVELREKRGLAYDVSAIYPTRLDPAQFIVYMGTAPENTAIAQAGLRTEVERLCDIILSPEELQVAKNKLLGQYTLGKQTNSEIAQIFGWYELLGLGVDFDYKFPQAIAKVTPEAVQRAALRYFSQSPYISLVGPAAEIGIN